MNFSLSIAWLPKIYKAVPAAGRVIFSLIYSGLLGLADTSIVLINS